jgi:hypothetical protein
MYTTTLNKIRLHNPCTDGWAKLLKALDKTRADDEPVSLAFILQSNGLDDAIWVLRCLEGADREIRLFAVECVHPVQYLLTDPRSLAVLEVAERFANGQATSRELGEAWYTAGAAADAAWAEARAAADAAGAAADAARARAEARAAADAAGAAADAAGAAARAADAAGAAADAAWLAADAAGAAAWAAAWAAADAAWAAAWAAAGAAADAAWAAARVKQAEIFLKYFGE